jgi:hypothetical protein
VLGYVRWGGGGAGSERLELAGKFKCVRRTRASDELNLLILYVSLHHHIISTPEYPSLFKNGAIANGIYIPYPGGLIFTVLRLTLPSVIGVT